MEWEAWSKLQLAFLPGLLDQLARVDHENAPALLIHELTALAHLGLHGW